MLLVILHHMIYVLETESLSCAEDVKADHSALVVGIKPALITLQYFLFWLSKAKRSSQFEVSVPNRYCRYVPDIWYLGFVHHYMSLVLSKCSQVSLPSKDHRKEQVLNLLLKFSVLINLVVYRWELEQVYRLVEHARKGV